jgi:hypothetical protein
MMQHGGEKKKAPTSRGTFANGGVTMKEVLLSEAHPHLRIN